VTPCHVGERVHGQRDDRRDQVRGIDELVERFAAEKIQAAIETGKPAKPSSIPPPVTPTKAGGGGSTTSSPPPPSVSTRPIPGFRWEGGVPWQKWSRFYSKVFSRFSQKGLKLRVVVEVAPPAGVSEQEVQKTPTALKELGLAADVKARD
jgi:hypothetical protein